MKVLAIQCSAEGVTTPGARDRHLERLVTLIRGKCAQRLPELVLLPELSSMDCSDEALSNIKQLSEKLQGGPSFRAFSGLARELGTAIAYGLPRREGGSIHITHAVVDGKGSLMASYDKVHLCPWEGSREPEIFAPGQKACIFELGGMRFAIALGHDIRYGGYIWELATRGELDAILHPSAFRRDDAFKGWHHFALTRSMENHVYLLSLNRAGRDHGRSIFCPPWTDDMHGPFMLALAEEAAPLELERVDIEAARRKFPLVHPESYDGMFGK